MLLDQRAWRSARNGANMKLFSIAVFLCLLNVPADPVLVPHLFCNLLTSACTSWLPWPLLPRQPFIQPYFLLRIHFLSSIHMPKDKNLTGPLHRFWKASLQVTIPVIRWSTLIQSAMG